MVTHVASLWIHENVPANEGVWYPDQHEATTKDKRGSTGADNNDDVPLIPPNLKHSAAELTLADL